jgi:hypothetical protein
MFLEYLSLGKGPFTGPRGMLEKSVRDLYGEICQ